MSLHNYQAKRILKCLTPSVGAIVIGILTFDYSTKEPALGTNIGRTESNSGMILSNEGAAGGLDNAYMRYYFGAESVGAEGAL